MSTKGKLTREQAIEIVGLESVEAVERKNCDYTGRLQTDGDTRVEFSAGVACEDNDGHICTLVAYYYQEQDDLDSIEQLDELNWEIEGYEVV